MKTIYLILLLVAALSCSSSKNSVKAFSHDDFLIGRSQSSLIGKIVKLTSDKESHEIRLLVASMKQGGATAPAVGVNSEVTVICTPLFSKNYKTRNNKSLEDVLKTDDEILMLVSKNLRSQKLEAIQIITQN